MANRVTVWWQGEEYDAVRQSDGESSSPVWRVQHEGAPVSSFAAEPGESAGTVKGKILEWLEANRSRPALDVGRQ